MSSAKTISHYEISNLGRYIKENNVLEFDYLISSLLRRKVFLDHFDDSYNWTFSLLSRVLFSCNKIPIKNSFHFLNQLETLHYDFNETIDQQNNNALQLAISLQLPNEVILFLIKKKVNVNYIGNSNTYSPLAFACQVNNLDYVNILLENGALKITEEYGMFAYPLPLILEKKSNKCIIAKSILDHYPNLIYEFIKYDEYDVVYHVLQCDANWMIYPYVERIKFLKHLLSFHHKHCYGSKVAALNILGDNDLNLNIHYINDIKEEQQLQESKYHKYVQIVEPVKPAQGREIVGM